MTRPVTRSQVSKASAAASRRRAVSSASRPSKRAKVSKSRTSSASSRHQQEASTTPSEGPDQGPGSESSSTSGTTTGTTTDQHGPAPKNEEVPHTSPIAAPPGSSNLPPTYLASPDTYLRTYPVTHNEVGVLTIEPYKATLLRHWRFKTPAVAQDSAAMLWQAFREYGALDDFVGMDMARKFIQMGMTRAKRYANYAGGRKYTPAPSDGADDEAKAVRGRDGKPRGRQLDKSSAHQGKADKEQASLIFRGYWERCKQDEKYQALKEAFLEQRRSLEQKEGVKLGKWEWKKG